MVNDVEIHNSDSSDKERLKELQRIVRTNSATADDYVEYEQILESKGVSHERIWKPLKEQGIDSWEEYIVKKQNAKTFEEKRVLDAVIKGALVGLGLYILFSMLKEK
tara:strand:- start:421 stop:741 length:321 start_codon:yes stop_codon:yes gene_type:complete